MVINGDGDDDDDDKLVVDAITWILFVSSLVAYAQHYHTNCFCFVFNEFQN